ncbi:MAG TPA: hypothetical protein PLO65_15305 [Caulobacter sp.]|nr:hypothetical protein [Caulobacter sp.]
MKQDPLSDTTGCGPGNPPSQDLSAPQVENGFTFAILRVEMGRIVVLEIDPDDDSEKDGDDRHSGALAGKSNR